MSAITPQRRPTAASRFRETRSRPPSSTTVTAAAGQSRRKSRSPDTRAQEHIPGDIAPRNGMFTTFVKKKRSGPNVEPVPGPSSTVSSTAATTSTVDEFGVERGRRTKNHGNNGRSHAANARDAEVVVIQGNPISRKQARGRRKDKGKDKDRSRSKSQGGSGVATNTKKGNILEETETNAGANAADDVLLTMDYDQLREELEMMKRHLASAKKTIHKQTKAMEDLKKDVANAQKSHSEERQQTARLKAESKRLNDMINLVEANLACQICMDMLMKPYGLSPCGHVLCLHCLQEWFRTSPPGVEDMDDDNLESPLYRKKTCPVCRTDVFHRPIPVFVIKSIANAFDKAKPGSPRQPSPPHEGDPWEGIFPEAISPYEEEYHDAESDDMDSVEDDEYDDNSDGEWPVVEYGSQSEDDYYDGEYVFPRWGPPTVQVSPDDYPFNDMSPEVISMLRRGASPQMIQLFQMSYTHEEGLLAIMNGHKVYLGWNISLQREDHTGESYMEWIEADVINNPERWDRVEDDDGEHYTAWRLVKEEEDNEYEDTDSEGWADPTDVGFIDF